MDFHQPIGVLNFLNKNVKVELFSKKLIEEEIYINLDYGMEENPSGIALDGTICYLDFLLHF